MGVSYLRPYTLRGFLVYSGVFLLGCGGVSPVAPSGKVVLTVLVRERANETLITGATVWLNGERAGQTDNLGSFAVDVAPGAFLKVDVTADGYIGFGADGSIANAESWTFYLERGSEGRP